MPLPIYLAMTAAEFRQKSSFSGSIAWMACHFSPYGTGLSGHPETLPAGSMLIVNDRTPVCGHDPALITSQLVQLVEQFGCSRVLLDLQRPGEAETVQIVKAVLKALPCPVGVSECYAENLSCPVFLPPVPLLQSPEAYLAPWVQREIWLETALSCGSYQVSAQGCRSLPYSPGEKQNIRRDDRLFCQYSIESGKDTVTFSLTRTAADLQALYQAVEPLGVSCLVGLYQELG